MFFHRGCTNKDKSCGPFSISKPYWIDAGSCTKNGDFEENTRGLKNNSWKFRNFLFISGANKKFIIKK